MYFSSGELYNVISTMSITKQHVRAGNGWKLDTWCISMDLEENLGFWVYGEMENERGLWYHI
jgi:hypothetical protein